MSPDAAGTPVGGATNDAGGSVQDRINGYWDLRAPSYDAWQRRPDRWQADRPYWQQVWAEALPTPPADVLDVGTGNGQVACVLAAAGHRVTAIDLAPGMLETARANAARETSPPRIVAGDAVAPPFDAGSFDAVTGRYLMWTLREPRTALAAWCRLLRPGGRVAMVDATWFPHGLDDPDDRPGAAGLDMRGFYDGEVLSVLPVATARSIDETAQLLRDAGLCDVRVRPLEELRDLDRCRGVAPGHRVQLQYLVSGTTPEASAP